MCVCVFVHACVRACGCVRLDVIDQEMRAAGVRACVYVCLDVIDQEIVCV